MEISAIKNWLQWLGSGFDIKEAHNRFRSGMKPPADYFIFRILSSQQTSGRPVVDKTDSSYDSTLSYNGRFKTLVRVECHAENAVLVLQSLNACREDRAVRSYFGDGVACLGLASPIEDITEHDETYGEVARNTAYAATFEFDEMVEYEISKTNETWDEYTLTGDLIDVDDETEIPITATNATGGGGGQELM